MKREHQFYILRGEAVVPATEDEWLAFAREQHPIHVGRDILPSGTLVSTVFLIVNHGTDRHPLHFETMVFRGDLSCHREDCPHGACIRYQTWEAAARGHTEVLNAVRVHEA